MNDDLSHPSTSKYSSNIVDAEEPLLTWSDTFFDNEPDVIAVFDFDYPAIESFKTSVGWISMICLFPSAVCLVPCYLNANVKWQARAMHVALTVDGIKFVDDKHKTWCGLMCSDKGKVSKTVP